MTAVESTTVFPPHGFICIYTLESEIVDAFFLEILEREYLSASRGRGKTALSTLEALMAYAPLAAILWNVELETSKVSTLGVPSTAPDSAFRTFG